ncbi:MAG TPA: bifunctional phosphoribosylaminoimidazolecarboxamide formyltransferase/inosine monophosphate cyclohydrolase [Cyanobacteria bacterium UBA8156]|jgi:phosphoribosylaminoimidazolecarboxamide formyltransferase/IMP cyclohydrolase|nr:bifunctional phosphoribosylaminoimidazolecarboxamide formyltransferase/inosine monophosphate cyclohydrolase [Cyanobacteria bacterium UBA8156]
MAAQPNALLSVSDKTGLVDLARALVEIHGFRLISSGGTAQTLQGAGLPVTKVAEFTGAPEMLGGRVKTLHPRIHGGILGRFDLDADEMAVHGLEPIALVVVNLYPFAETIARPGVTLTEAIENIDIGGPTLLRAAAKNHAYVAVLCQPSQYGAYLDRCAHGGLDLDFRRQLAQAAFAHTHSYDRAIAAYLTNTPENSHPSAFTLTGALHQALRYGENPHQRAAWYATEARGWAVANQLQGKELSYNNLLDLEAARAIAAAFVQDEPAAVIVKHTNPCGVALAPTLLGAYQRALAADPVSAFGGIVALTRPLDVDTATALCETFLECVVVPGCDPQAATVLSRKPNLRLLLLPDLAAAPSATLRAIAGGVLVQDGDHAPSQPETWQVVTNRVPTAAQQADLIFAWEVVRQVKSNAIVVAGEGMTLGIGSGQTNRVGAADIALAQAGSKAVGAVLASDGFFPFDDTVRKAAAAGIRAIVQPGGSLRDADSIQAANELGVAMVFTGRRHFCH